MTRALPACIQPRLGLTVHGQIPPGCFGYLVEDDDCAPVLRPGEFAVIDASTREPEAGALFLIEYNQGDRHLVEIALRSHCNRKTGKVDFTWWAVSYNRPRSPKEVERALRAGRLQSSDGPYPADGVYLASKLIGKVVGVLAPDRHSREELMRRRDVACCPPHILAEGYGAKPVGYVEPAGSASYRGGEA